ncbi:MAG TPA: hypothetical protein GXZ59_06115, partial [Clostridiaceae bacterium]|nr:hypothetical protein [Clostridiaceae bacterium]
MPFAPVTIRDEAAAKINLSLDVIDRRDDGYHNIDSVMQAISLTDGVTVAVAPFLRPENGGGADVRQVKPDQQTDHLAWHRAFVCQETLLSIALKCSRSVPIDETNTAVKAARLWCQYTAAANLEIKITLEKHIPMGSGLGGGSSDAATVLRLLNRLAREKKIGVAPLSAKLLLDIAAMIGADVPFFLYGGIARCLGIGEIVDPLKPLPQWPLILAIPAFSFSTAARYKALDGLAMELLRRPDTEALLQAIDRRDLFGINENAFNVFSNLPDANVA